MKKLLAKSLALGLMFLNLLPLTAFAVENNDAPAKPYEKVVAKSGKWYAEQLAYNGRTNLVVGYTGKYAANNVGQGITFEVKEKIVLAGIYLPLLNSGLATIPPVPDNGSNNGGLSGSLNGITLSLTDDRGNVYQGFSGEIHESHENGDLKSENVTGIFLPNGEIVLPKGHYTIGVEGSNGLVGAFLVKGVNFTASEKYKQTLREWERQNNLVLGEQTEQALGNGTFGDEVFGNEVIMEDTVANLQYGESAAVNPPVFRLDEAYQIDEIIVSTYNEGQGALPGVITLHDENGKALYSGQSYGVGISEIPNSAWKIAPNLLLPAGVYSLTLSQPEVLSYDQDGEPLFYVKASVPVQLREDFTGTYKVNFDAYKTSTLQGTVAEKSSSFSLHDFELTVLDKGGELELIGQYENLPFSQRCVVIEETAKKVVASFQFGADLTKLPYQAKITAQATVTLAKTGGKGLVLRMEGTGTYDREASVEKGADHNTYELQATGTLTQRELPPFVMTALGKASGAGNIPGPDNATQAAAGILFPPLVGVVVNVIQDLMKPKVQPRGVRRDKSWYQKKYPNLSEEQLAMVMLADAMGNTDNPDEGDVVSVGDNELGAGESDSSNVASSVEFATEEPIDEEYTDGDYPAGEYPDGEYTDEKPALGTEAADENEIGSESEYGSEQGFAEKISPASGEEGWTEAQPDSTGEQLPQEPETIVVQTSANGAETLYVKDPQTGEWVDPETNSVLDLEKHKEVLERLKQEKEWNDAEFAKSSAGETTHDKILRGNMAKIRKQEDKENYQNILRRKYGTDDLGEIEDIVQERKQQAAEWAAVWLRNEQILGVAEAGAVAVGTASDVAIDGLAVVTPGGTKIRAGYKVLKGVAGTMAEAGAQGKDIVNLGNIAEGAIKGGADAALDYIPGSGLKTVATKAGVSVLGESAGSAAGAALRGEDVGKAFGDGLKSGAYKATVGAVTDAVAGDLPNPIVSRGSFKAVPNMKNVIVSRAGGTKIGAALVDEYGVKPIVMGE